MAIIVKPFTHTNGTIADAIEVNANNDTVYSCVNGNIDSPNLGNNAVTTGKILDANVTFAKLDVPTQNAFVPIGSIIPFYDFNATVTFNSTYWEYCDGTVIANASSPLNTLTKPDMSGRYLVGYGTEKAVATLVTDGNKDIGSAVWSLNLVGEANHQVDLQHAHTMSGHTHTMGNHIHTMPTHSHSFSDSFTTLPSGDHHHEVARYWTQSGGWGIAHYRGTYAGSNFASLGLTTSNGQSGSGAHRLNTSSVSGMSNGQDFDSSTDGSHTHTGTASGTTGAIDPGDTDSTDLGDTNSTTDTMNNQLSTTQTIQPRSIRVRYIMRVL